MCFIHFMSKDNYNLVKHRKIEKLCVCKTNMLKLTKGKILKDIFSNGIMDLTRIFLSVHACAGTHAHTHTQKLINKLVV